MPFPRLLEASGIGPGIKVDKGAKPLARATRYSHAYRALQPRELTNIYAAFPSLHFDWNLLVGIALFRHAPWRAARIAGALTPAAMGLAVVATANHFVIDVPAGAVVALTGLVAARWILLHPPSPHAAPRRRGRRSARHRRGGVAGRQ